MLEQYMEQTFGLGISPKKGIPLSTSVMGELGYMKPWLGTPVCQHAVSYEQAEAIYELCDGPEDLDAGLAKALEAGIIDQKSFDEVTSMIKTGMQLSPEDAYELAMKIQGDVGYTPAEGGYPIPGTNVVRFGGADADIHEPKKGEPFYGQDAHYPAPTSYTNLGDSTFVDNITGLQWQKNPGPKQSWQAAVEGLDEFNALKLGGYDDWRIPTIKELYSLAYFTGHVSMFRGSGSIPFGNTYYMVQRDDFVPGDRFMDGQMTTSSIYRGATLGSVSAMFGFNLVDGHIKGYGIPKNFYCYHVRGNTNYGQNLFVDNGDGTISDLATGLMWLKDDSGAFQAGGAGDGTLDWQEALAWCENLEAAGYDDWKLPNAKELHSIVDYTRNPDATDSPAIDPLFNSTEIVNLLGMKDWGYYWSSTPFEKIDSVYIAFGRGMGNMGGMGMDVHGAGCQRTDTRVGDRSKLPYFDSESPQGDIQRVYNMVRPCRKIK